MGLPRRRRRSAGLQAKLPIRPSPTGTSTRAHLAAKLAGGRIKCVAGLRNMDDKYGQARLAAYVTLLRRADGTPETA